MHYCADPAEQIVQVIPDSGFRIHAVITFRTCFSQTDDAGLPQDEQVMRNSRTRQMRPLRDLAHAQAAGLILLLQQHQKHLLPCLLSERPKQLAFLCKALRQRKAVFRTIHQRFPFPHSDCCCIFALPLL